MPFKILSLDGGGPWSLIQARALGAVLGKDTPGLTLLANFDLVTCNSGGSLVVAGLLAGMSPSQIENDCFANQPRLHTIFSPSPTPLGAIDQVAGKFIGGGLYRYSTQAKLDAIRTILGAPADLTIPQLPTLFKTPLRSPRFLFTAFGYDRLREVHFRSDPLSPAAREDAMAPATLAEAVNASSSAPILYFDSPASVGAGAGRERFWDGAIGGYNNPVLLGVIEALAYGTARDDIRVLTIGSATVLQPLATQFPNANPDLTLPCPPYGLKNDLGKIAGSIIDDPPDAASLNAYIAMGQKLPPRANGRVQPQGSGNFVRMNPVIQPLWNGTDWVYPRSFAGADWVAMRDLELVAIQPQQIAMIQKLAAAWMASDPADIPNQPVRMGYPYFGCELGHASFAEALAVAQSWFPVPEA